ncbi:outer membrane protein assembly factor BamA [Methylicorpusculum sp.]|uniref:outer membrane protein assembly factor BamA n=1 Tax=Methylicorpusculum sp. TaxID=2713644 RepID=UPI002723082A|nr:outer membrane protein assembly factor BamA [Methylicorpusculum sp.]MDO8846397.1 outer membrane protein assembly factor BamA [Methylicorpusculum sp.]
MRLSALSVIIMLTLVFSQVVKSEDGFVVDNIQVNGLQRISVGTVYNYLPVNIGDVFSSDRIPVAVRALFKTGFFKDITIERSGSTLVVNVVERPSIAKILFEGNKDISSEDLLKALKNIGLSEGKVFNQQILEKVEQELRRQYFSHGKYGLKIDTEVADLTRNRVGINIKISEGRVAKIKQINVVGNKTFDNDDLQKDFELSTSNLLSFYTKDDQYSKQKLSADLERLRSYYLDRGYINFNIESTQVAITPDKKEIYITINVKEGDVYTLEKVKLAGNLIVQPDEITKLVQVGPGEIFSRRNATETSKAISDRLGDDGYVFANVNMVPDINEADKTVAMTFFVDPGKRVYVNRINMRGNTKTRDEVLRRELRQMEASWASNTKIERSKTRLERLGYFEEVNVETPPVVGTSDQIDVNYTVVERPSGNLTAGVGFSQTQGIILNANISQDNVFGSGKRLNLAFNNSDVSTNYRFGFLNPYFTLDGISLGYELGYRSTDARQANIASYTTDVANAGMNFGIPLNEFDTLRFNADVKHTSLDTTPSSSDEITNFIDEEGDSFLTFAPSIGWTHDTLNRFVFPTSGGQQRLSALATVPGSDLEYYKISYKQQEYFPIAKDLTFSLSAEAAYGDGYGKTDELPFFENYFAGGVRSVRGFNDNTLGPRDSTKRPLGGSTKLAGSAELFFPVPFMKESKSIRLGTFIDAGMVDDSFSFNEMRYSAGISGEWLSPFGAISVSVAKPINLEDQDDERNFQFSFGSGF